MNPRSEEMIGIFKNSFSDELCDSLIYFFNDSKDYYRDRKEYQNQRYLNVKDVSIDLEEANQELFQKCRSKLYEIFDMYSDNYDILKLGKHKIDNIKIQKTEPGEGFHVWHFERVPTFPSRQCAFTTYLNDVEEGGETEFLYLRKRVKPEMGTTTIFPAGYTHTHRGNPPLLGTKYILTGWIVNIK